MAQNLFQFKSLQLSLPRSTSLNRKIQDHAATLSGEPSSYPGPPFRDHLVSTHTPRAPPPSPTGCPYRTSRLPSRQFKYDTIPLTRNSRRTVTRSRNKQAIRSFLSIPLPSMRTPFTSCTDQLGETATSIFCFFPSLRF